VAGKVRPLACGTALFPCATAARNAALCRCTDRIDNAVGTIDFERLVYIINARIAGVARTRLEPRLAQLNDREIKVLTLVARGRTSTEIAAKLHMPKRTVDFHIDNARLKLDAATRTEAVVKAAGVGLIKP
jgi:DNA-binding NarL/FixJ family response regulator